MSILRAFPSAGHTHTSEICQVSRGAQVRRPVIFPVAHVQRGTDSRKSGFSSRSLSHCMLLPVLHRT
jgi:hypothetical protein